MKYRPYWQRIFFLAVIFNAVLLLASSSVFSTPEIEETPPEDLQEIEWVETEQTENVVQNLDVPPIETFPALEMPPLEIPHTEFEPLPKLNLEPPPPVQQPQPVEKPVEAETKTEPEQEKPKDDDILSKLKVIAKVYPKDIIDQLVIAGAIPERVALNSGKIVMAVTITKEGKVRNVEFRRGGGTDERGNLINLVAEIAAQSWLFEPFLDENGNPKELKTQIEFKPEDF